MNKTIIDFNKGENFFEKVKGINIKKNIHLLILLIVGLVLLVFGSNSFNTKETQEVMSSEQSTNTTVTEYEEKLAKLISQVDGAGRVEVMVTLESKGETVYAKTETGDEQIENDSGETSSRSGYSTEYIIVEDENGNKTALVENEYEPAILGVAVLCEGGGDTSIISDITELVKVVMGISSNHIFVGKLNDIS